MRTIDSSGCHVTARESNRDSITARHPDGGSSLNTQLGLILDSSDPRGSDPEFRAILSSLGGAQSRARAGCAGHGWATPQVSLWPRLMRCGHLGVDGQHLAFRLIGSRAKVGPKLSGRWDGIVKSKLR
jgi:hypothetical protein